MMSGPETSSMSSCCLKAEIAWIATWMGWFIYSERSKLWNIYSSLLVLTFAARVSVKEASSASVVETRILNLSSPALCQLVA